MAKPTYKVWVVNLIDFGTRIYDPDNQSYYFDWDQAKLTDVVSVLKSLFDEVCQNALSKFGDTDVTTTDLGTVAANIKTGELLLRITTKKKSILVKKYGEAAVSDNARGATKDTGSGNGVVSEIWLEGAAGSATVAKLLGRLAFHELMHNKLDAMDSAKDIHGTTDGTGLAAVPVSYDTALSDKNKKGMAPKLGSVVAQFTGTSIP